MTYTKIFIWCLIICFLGIAGCTSNTSTSSGFGSGSGYTIDLRATQTILPQGGQTILIASVKDNQGNPVNDSTRGLIFTSTQGATIDGEESINLGVCNATYTLPSSASLPSAVVDQVTASYQGAFAYVSIEVYKQ
ncbi:MAG: hypothetical protein HY787_07870 [Deltaproteobacteria bacterium]|nr:hypothetical protein [Deltaproteobacteria bacterium]